MKNWRITAAAIVGVIAAIGTAEAITDTAFIYSTAKTSWVSINPSDLAPDQNGVSYHITPAELFVTATTTSCFEGGVHLPQGATITQVAVWFRSSVGSDISVALDRMSLVDGILATVAVASPHDDSNFRKQINIVPQAANAVVNNGLYRYSFVVCPNSIANAFYGARIAYTFKSAGD